METHKFPGNYNSLPLIGKVVVAAAREAGLDERAVYAVQLAVDEACSNIIDHAYRGEGKGDILLKLNIEKGGLRIVLRDKGRPFDPAKVPEPKIGLPLKKIETRGVGLYLMHKLMDEIHYEATPDQGNILTMFKRKT